LDLASLSSRVGDGTAILCTHGPLTIETLSRPNQKAGWDGIPRATLLFLIVFYSTVMVALLRRPEYLVDVLPLALLLALVEWRRRA